MWDRFGTRSLPGKIRLTRAAPPSATETASPRAQPDHRGEAAAEYRDSLFESASEVEDRRWTQNGAQQSYSEAVGTTGQLKNASPLRGSRPTSDEQHSQLGQLSSIAADQTRQDDGVLAGDPTQKQHEAHQAVQAQPSKAAGASIAANSDATAQNDSKQPDELGPSAAAPAPSATNPVTAEQAKPQSRAMDSGRLARFHRELSSNSIDVEKLRELSWSGVPPHLKPHVWRLLLSYAPPNGDRREAVLARRRKEYRDWVGQYYDMPNEDRSDDEIHTLRQISVDCPRTVPDVPFFQQPAMQKALERVLYVWAIRHPASGYVQGINDLVTPFLTVFLSEVFGTDDMSTWPKVSTLGEDTLLVIEADCFWCLCKLLDGIQDHYTFAQPGIQRLVFRLRELVRRIDEPVARHIENNGLEFLQFAFRWFNCLLIREIPFRLVGRLWDTYLAEGDGFPEFLVYACASFLHTWSSELQKMDFQEMVLFLQHVPTEKWSQSELEVVLSRAFMWRVLFNHAPKHLAS